MGTTPHAPRPGGLFPIAPAPGDGTRLELPPGETVLVVEDDAECRAAIKDTLEQAGYIVLEAENGHRALELLLSVGAPTPAAIVLDLWMPQMTGWELLKVLRSYLRLSRIPVIVATADRSVRSDQLKATVSGWLPKPFDEEQLLSSLRFRG